ncbi:MAG: SRPBCC family protein [Acidimicrobiales bacterium]
MELTNEFVIDRGVEDTWKILNDLEFIAPCMPGAQLQEIEGDEYRGIVKVKVGPITAQYKGKASFVEQDATAKVARLKAEGRDPRQGNANAMITASMEPVGDAQTNVKIHTDLGLSGKIASFGRGAIEDVSKKILGQFTENLRQKLEAEGGPSAAPSEEAAPAATEAPAAEPEAPASEPAPAAEPEPPAPATEAAPAAATSAPASVSASAAAPTERPTVRKIEAPEAEPVDLLAVSGGTVAKRVLPAVGGAALVIAFLYWLLGRG